MEALGGGFARYSVDAKWLVPQLLSSSSAKPPRCPPHTRGTRVAPSAPAPTDGGAASHPKASRRLLSHSTPICRRKPTWS